MNTEQFEDDDQLLKELFHRSSSTPDEALKTRILQNVTIKKEVFEYQPVIGKKAWITITVGFLASIIALIISSNSAKWSFNLEKWRELNFLERFTIPDGFFQGWFELQLNQVPSAFLIALVALIVFGLYFIISFKFGKNFLSDY